jgi:DNA-binding MarR family transcriptional regulator
MSTDFPLFALVEHYKAYLETEQGAENQDIRSFAGWLLTQTAPLPDSEPDGQDLVFQDRLAGFKRQIDHLERQTGQTKAMELAEMAMLWGQLDRCRHHLYKRAMLDMPVGKVEEFVLLVFLHIHGSSTKGAFAHEAMLEPTTAMEMIRRMVAKGLVQEKPDPEDRRARRMQLTEAGRQVAQDAMDAMHPVNEWLFGHLAQTERSQWISKLRAMLAAWEKMVQNPENKPHQG